MDTQMNFDDVEDAAVPGETKADRFRRICNPRAAIAVKRLRLIRQMVEGANANNYEFTDAQRLALVSALAREVESIDELMRKRLSKDDETTLFV